MGKLAESLNQNCQCVSMDRQRLQSALALSLAADKVDALLAERPHLFSEAPVFLSGDWVQKMQRAIRSVEAVLASPGFRRRLGISEAVDQPVERGMFMGYDFHMTPEGPRLIEINTNAGGAYLNLALGRAILKCCDAIAPLAEWQERQMAIAEEAIKKMFLAEFARFDASRPLQTIALCDREPEQQYLFPEFLLWQKQMRDAGLHALIVDPRQLEHRSDGLYYEDRRIDMIYNRLTDFALQDADSAALASAWQARTVALSPNPLHHRLYAQKSNLALLSDPLELAAMGIDESHIEILQQSVMPGVVVSKENADLLWRDRKRWFFKPESGFGSRGAYRGEKLTTRVYSEIVKGGYIAQAYCPPSERQISKEQRLKMDVRSYVYDGQLQLLASRLYQGQTTNFRTPGGGFAPLYITPEFSGARDQEPVAKTIRMGS
ncbi:MAG: circularly permuted ATPgrasp domain protein [Leptospirales bacterium]|nr:circularly permuted ATPgrasp domain protein [Leptospirales bacterium]